MMKALRLLSSLLLIIHTTVVYGLPPEEISSFESITTQAISNEDITTPYTITGESIVNIIQGMVGFDIDGSSIVYNRRSGQIFVRHTPSQHAVIEDILARLRSASFQQIDIEARLITIEETDLFEFGVDFAGFDYKTDHGSTSFGTQVPDVSGTFGSGVDFESFVNELNDTTAGGQFTAAAFGSLFDIQTVIEALEQQTQVNTVAAPRITVFNNQRANLKIERRENFISEIDANFDAVSGLGVATVFFQLETKIKQAQSGTVLDVTPSINSNGTITLELHPHYVTADLTTEQNFTNITGGEEFTNPVVLPVFVSQSIDTILSIPNGGVAVLGGLISEEEQKDFSKMPFFGDIPWIGKIFFTQEKTEETRKYLLIFIKAKIKEPKRA